MVKLLRFYVSEDVVYLHLEHVKGEPSTFMPPDFGIISCFCATSLVPGGRLFSKLHKLRNEKAKEHPECVSSGQHIKLKTSYTSPAICADYQHVTGGSTALKPSDESPDADDQTSWDETQQRLESCGTHSYIEETGCLQNTRSAASFHTRLDRLTLLSGPMRTQVSARIHPPAPSLCLHSAETQEKAALPLSCARVTQALDSMSGQRKAGVGLMECSSDFELAWKSADQTHGREKANPYAVAGSDFSSTLFLKTHSDGESTSLSSSPAILHLPLHCQTQIRGRASWETADSRQGSVLTGNSADVTSKAANRDGGSSPPTEDRYGVVFIRSTDRAVFSDQTDTQTTSEPPWAKVKGDACSSEARDGVCDPDRPGEKVAPTTGGFFSSWYSSGALNTKADDVHSFLKPGGKGDDQIIEVDGWCHVPRIPVTSSTSTDKSMQGCWGLPEAEVRVWGAQILLALESLHEQGIVCRDLNPRNILVTSNGECHAGLNEGSCYNQWTMNELVFWFFLQERCV